MARPARPETPLDGGDLPLDGGGLPAAVVLLRTHGFVDEYGENWSFAAGRVVRHPFLVGMLLERGAPVAPTE